MTITHAMRWIGLSVLAVALLLSAGCDESSSSSDSGTELTVGTARDESIDANATNKYTFTADSGAAHQIDLTAVSTGAASDLSVEPGSLGSLACVSIGSAKSCGTPTLSAGKSYSFKIKEEGGQAATFTITVYVP